MKAVRHTDRGACGVCFQAPSQSQCRVQSRSGMCLGSCMGEGVTEVHFASKAGAKLLCFDCALV